MDALIFDLFNTLVRWDAALLPRMAVAGKTVPSTLGLVSNVLNDHGHHVEIDVLASVAMRVSRKQEEEKLRTGREFPSAHRWSAVLAEFEIDPNPQLVDEMVRHHMGALCGSAVITDGDRVALEHFADRLPLALLSNFDHGPSARALLDRLELTPLFRSIAISDDLGWRKPEARVFMHVVDDLRLAPDACVYVGDSVEFDMAGAHNAGLQAAWITKPEAVWPAEMPPPAYRAVTIADLESQIVAR